MSTNEERQKWNAEKTTLYGIRIMNETGIPDALKKTGVSPTVYIRQAIFEKLERDGLIKPGIPIIKNSGGDKRKK